MNQVQRDPLTRQPINLAARWETIGQPTSTEVTMTVRPTMTASTTSQIFVITFESWECPVCIFSVFAFMVASFQAFCFAFVSLYSKDRATLLKTANILQKCVITASYGLKLVIQEFWQQGAECCKCNED